MEFIRILLIIDLFLPYARFAPLSERKKKKKKEETIKRGKLLDGFKRLNTEEEYNTKIIKI